MTWRHERTDTRRKGRGALISCAAVVILAGCSSTVDGRATFSADGAAHGRGPGLSLPTAAGASGDGSGSSDSTTTATPSPTATHKPKPKPKPRPKLKAEIHGWQPVGHTKRRIAYDVPPNWKIFSADTSTGFGSKVAMSAASGYRTGFCTGHSGLSLAGAGVAASRGSRLAVAAHAAARDWAEAAFEAGARHPTMKIGKPKSLRVPGVHAVEVVANVTVPKPGRCGSPRGMVQAVAISGGRSSGIFIVYADLDVRSAAPTRVLNEMVGSVRRIP